MPILAALPWILTGVSGVAGALGNRGSTSTSTQNQTGTTDQTTNQSGTTTQTGTQDYKDTSMPQYTPEMARIMDYLMSTMRNRLQSSTDLSGYQTQGLQNINQGADLKRRVMENMLASRGLSASPTTANSISRIESGRIGDQMSFLNQIPLLQRQLQGEDLNTYANFFKSLPVGTQRTGSSTTNQTGTSTGTSRTTGTTTGQATGTQTQPGNILGGLFSGLGTGLATAFGGITPKKSSSNYGGDPYAPGGGYDWLP